MNITTEPVLVLHRGEYGEDVRWKSGAPIEAVKVMDPASGTIYENLTLGEQLPNVERLKLGQHVRLRLLWVRELVAGRSASGRDFVRAKDKFRVIGVEPAAAAA